MPNCQFESTFSLYALQKHGLQFLCVGYLAILRVLQTVEHWVIVWLMNHKWERIWKEAVVGWLRCCLSICVEAEIYLWMLYRWSLLILLDVLQYFMHTSRSQGVHFPSSRPASASCILHRRKSSGSDKRTHSGKLSFCTGVDSMPLALHGLQLCPNLVSQQMHCHFKFKHICTHLTVHCNAWQWQWDLG